ncbi:MAG: hypothetical protein ACRC42_01865 [Mycoplasma sp.]
MINKKSVEFDVKVTENSKGYKVVVTEKEKTVTRNTRVSASPLKALAGGKLNLRVIAGKKKEVSSVKDKDEMTLSKDSWSVQLDKWAEIESFSDEIKNEIAKKIKVIEHVKG